MLNQVTINRAAFMVIVAVRNDAEVNLSIDDNCSDNIYIVKQNNGRVIAVTSWGEEYYLPNKDAIREFVKYYLEDNWNVECLHINDATIFFDTLEEFVDTVKELRETGVLK